MRKTAKAVRPPALTEAEIAVELRRRIRKMRRQDTAKMVATARVYATMQSRKVRKGFHFSYWVELFLTNSKGEKATIKAQVSRKLFEKMDEFRK